MERGEKGDCDCKSVFIYNADLEKVLHRYCSERREREIKREREDERSIRSNIEEELKILKDKEI